MERFFHSLESFSRFCERQAVIAETALHTGAEAASIVLHEKITGAFGDAQKLRDLAQATQEERAAAGFSPNDPLVRTGELERSVEHAHAESIAAVGTSDPKMVWLEFGYFNVRAGHFVAPIPAFEVGLRDAEPEIAAITEGIVSVILGSGPIPLPKP